MTIRPCIYCSQAKDCDLKREKLAIVRPAKLTNITFRCERLKAMFEPGDEVRVRLPAPSYFSGDFISVVGTVWHWKHAGCKHLLIFVHPDQNPTADRPLVKTRPKYVAKTGIKHPVCKHCQKPKHIDLPYGLKTVAEAVAAHMKIDGDIPPGLIAGPWMCTNWDSDTSEYRPCEYD